MHWTLFPITTYWVVGCLFTDLVGGGCEGSAPVEQAIGLDALTADLWPRGRRRDAVSTHS